MAADGLVKPKLVPCIPRVCVLHIWIKYSGNESPFKIDMMCLLGKKLVVLWGVIFDVDVFKMSSKWSLEKTHCFYFWKSARGPYVVQSRGIAFYLWSWALDGGEWWAWCSGRLFQGRVPQAPIEEGVGWTSGSHLGWRPWLFFLQSHDWIAPETGPWPCLGDRLTL